MATRVASGKVMNAIAPRLPALLGGSADLNPSTFTALAKLGDFLPPEGSNTFGRVDGHSPSDGSTEYPPEGIETFGRDHQGSVGGGWSYAGRNLHFGVREHGMGCGNDECRMTNDESMPNAECRMPEEAVARSASSIRHS